MRRALVFEAAQCWYSTPTRSATTFAARAKPRLKALALLLETMQSLPFDRQFAEQVAHIRAALEAADTPIGPHDILIAATALRHHGTLVTRNGREFERVPGLAVVNWHDE